MQRIKALKRGLRWSPRPMKEYLAEWKLGPGVAALHAKFTQRPDVWNLFWISAANCEKPPYLGEPQVQYLVSLAEQTAIGLVDGKRVGDLSLTLMPADFTDLLEENPEETQHLAFMKAFGPTWLILTRYRAELFYEARKSEQGLTVASPISQGETILDESTNIISFFGLRGRRS